jgi:hypothetical protein
MTPLVMGILSIAGSLLLWLGAADSILAQPRFRYPDLSPEDAREMVYLDHQLGLWAALTPEEREEVERELRPSWRPTALRLKRPAEYEEYDPTQVSQ